MANAAPNQGSQVVGGRLAGVAFDSKISEIEIRLDRSLKRTHPMSMVHSRWGRVFFILIAPWSKIEESNLGT